MRLAMTALETCLLPRMLMDSTVRPFRSPLAVTLPGIAGEMDAVVGLVCACARAAQKSAAVSSPAPTIRNAANANPSRFTQCAQSSESLLYVSRPRVVPSHGRAASKCSQAATRGKGQQQCMNHEIRKTKFASHDDAQLRE